MGLSMDGVGRGWGLGMDGCLAWMGVGHGWVLGMDGGHEVWAAMLGLEPQYNIRVIVYFFKSLSPLSSVPVPNINRGCLDAKRGKRR